MEKVLLSTEGLLPGTKPYSTGKVRDIYGLDNKLLIVATDRISAFDVVLPNGIPHKGKVLNGLSVFWFYHTWNDCENHMITADVTRYPEELQPYSDLLKGRSMLVKKARRVDIECVVRGYLSGSSWKGYQDNDGMVCGVQLPAGLRESEKLSEPIFTPSTKSKSGHDLNIPFDEMVKIIKELIKRGEIRYGGTAEELANEMCSKSLALYEVGASYAETKGLILADTKFEFGTFFGRLILIDELLTPDSSRYWSKDDYEPGRPQKSYDKQYVRDYLESIDWNKEPPAPELPPEVIQKTSEKYLEAYRRLTGKDFLVQDIS